MTIALQLSYAVAAAALSCLFICYPQAEQLQGKPFTVVDEIGLRLFGTPLGDLPDVHFSPNGKNFAVWSERGRIDLNCVEDSVRFYRSSEAAAFLRRVGGPQSLIPAWAVTLCTSGEGPIINDWEWLADSSGIAFLERRADGFNRLVIADLRTKTVSPLTPTTQNVASFDVRDRRHYLYNVIDPIEADRWREEQSAPAVVGTGRWIQGLLLSRNPLTDPFLYRVTKLRGMEGGHDFEINQNRTAIYSAEDIALSPNGRSAVMTLPVNDVPLSWETLYPPPFASDPDRIRAGHFDTRNRSTVRRFVWVDLITGEIQNLTGGPTSSSAGWWADGKPGWSNDGRAIILPGAFTDQENGPARPCIAVFAVLSKNLSCVEMLKGKTEDGFEAGYHSVKNPHFAQGDRSGVQVPFIDLKNKSYRRTDYRRDLDGKWLVVGQFDNPSEIGPNGLEVFVKQSFDLSPRLVAKDERSTRVIWDPNPQLSHFEAVDVSVYTWKNPDGRAWKGGLYKPVGYKAGQRYPLVVQTHGFTEGEFRPSGVFPTAFAARALAGAGIAVLQVGYPLGASCPVGTPDENPCWVSTYEAAINQLVGDGLADPTKIGIIGFSHSCEGVLAMLTTSSLVIKAASLTDGVMTSYVQSMMTVDFHNNAIGDLGNRLVGAAPFGDGLQQWFKHAPGFNLDKVKTPLLVAGMGPQSLLLMMWEPYAGLRYLKKPVDLLMLNTDEHVLTNPAVRIASQGGSVDWFRFWLQGYEDPDPAKRDQYTRWRGLRELQVKDTSVPEQ